MHLSVSNVYINICELFMIPTHDDVGLYFSLKNMSTFINSVTFLGKRGTMTNMDTFVW